MKLYYAPAACSLAPHIAAAEADIPIELVRVEFSADGKTAAGRNYLEINPKGAVPALQLDSGEVLTENAVLLQYLAAQAPESDLMPRDGMARWRLLELLNFIATEVHKGFGPLWNPATTPEARTATVETLGKKFDVLEKQLGEDAWLTGDKFTIADAYAYAVLNWTRIHKIDIARWPRLKDFLSRAEQRPGVHKALTEEGLA
jgi:glutathione S-transferase